MRLFVAIPLPKTMQEGLRGRVAEWRQNAPPAIRWTPPEQWHITMRFLGEVPEENLPEVLDWFQGSLKDQPGGRLDFGQTEFFGRRDQFVLWAGFENAGWMGRAANRIRKAVAGIEADTRPFHAHLTLARWQADRRAGATWRPFLSGFAGTKLTPLSGPAEEVVLYRSELSAAGARFERLAADPLLSMMGD